MSIVLPALAVAFAACCVGLVVRIVNRRERWAILTAVAITVLVVYPLSIGPAIWLRLQKWSPDWAGDAYNVIYAPVIGVYSYSPEPIRTTIYMYAEFWAERA